MYSAETQPAPSKKPPWVGRAMCMQSGHHTVASVVGCPLCKNHTTRPITLKAEKKRGDARIELATSCTQSKNHTTRPITRDTRKVKRVIGLVVRFLLRVQEVASSILASPLFFFGSFWGCSALFFAAEKIPPAFRASKITPRYSGKSGMAILGQNCISHSA